MSSRMNFTNINSSKYLTLRKVTSSQRQTRKFRPNNSRPSLYAPSERVPTGQSHEQNDFLAKRLMSRIARKITSAAGWTGWIFPETSQYFRLVKAPMGRNPSTPGGRETRGAVAPLSTAATNMPKRMPIPTTQNIKHHCTTVRTVLTDFAEIEPM